MKKLKDLTKEQAIEIAKLIYPFPDWIKSDFNFFYHPYKAPDNWDNEGITEEVLVTFKGFTTGEKIEDIHLNIYTNLDCVLGCFELKNSKYWSHKYSLMVRNQHAVQKKFIDWGFEPDYTKE
jgi:hypothetical protein